MMLASTRIVRSIALGALWALAPLELHAGDRLPAARPATEYSGAALVGDVLAAVGHDHDTVARGQRSFSVLVKQLRAAETVGGDARQRIRAIHTFLHAQVLRGTYQASASDPGAALLGGAYNCASATALFVALAREFGVEAYPVSVVGHVWCRVEASGGSFDVETTCRDWFVLLARREARQPGDVSRDTPAWQDHVRRAAAARRLGEREFLAIFHYNRGVHMLREGRFSAAAAANLAALWLDWRCEPAYGNLAAALAGWTETQGKRLAPEISAAPAR
jgi:hypothetical protein